MYVPFIFLKKKVYIPLYFYSLPFYITFWKSICFFFQKLEKTCQNQHRKTRPIQYTYRLHDRKFGFERKPNIRIRYSDARHASWVKDWSKALFSILWKLRFSVSKATRFWIRNFLPIQILILITLCWYRYGCNDSDLLFEDDLLDDEVPVRWKQNDPWAELG